MDDVLRIEPQPAVGISYRRYMAAWMQWLAEVREPPAYARWADDGGCTALSPNARHEPSGAD